VAVAYAVAAGKSTLGQFVWRGQESGSPKGNQKKGAVVERLRVSRAGGDAHVHDSGSKPVDSHT
jgi:hypothetical protein